MLTQIAPPLFLTKITIFLKRKNYLEDWHCFFQTSLMSGLRENSCISCLLLHIVCCDITHHVASGKLHCAFGENQMKKIMSLCYSENSFDLLPGRSGALHS